MGTFTDAFNEFKLKIELMNEEDQAMVTIDDPRFVEYQRFVDERLYLRWHHARLDEKPVWANDMMYTELENIVIDWLIENCTGSFMIRHWSVNFENPRDKLLFKLSF